MRLPIRLTIQVVQASVFTCIFCANATAQPASNTNSSIPATMQMPAAVPLFIDDADFTSTLTLVNVAAVQTYADVTVRALNGRTVATKRVQFQPHSQQQVNIRTLLNSAGASAIATGSITVMQSSALNGTAITAVLSMTRLNLSSPNYINEEIAMPSAEGSQFLRAVADEGDGSPIVALTSLSNMDQHVKVSCLSGDKTRSSKSVDISAGETLLTEACSKETLHGTDFQRYEDDEREDHINGPVGIELKSDGMPGSFAAFALKAHGSKTDRYFSSIAFVDPKMIKSTTTVFAGVPVGSAIQLPEGDYVPTISLANFSTKDAHVTIQYSRTTQENPVTQSLGTVVVPALSSKAISFNALEGDPTMQNSFAVVADGTPGDISAKLVARGNSRLREVELLGKDLMDPQNGGNHPWTVENGIVSTLLLFNTSSTPQYFDVVITGGGITWQSSYQLQPGQTKAISINDLIKNQIKDAKGRVLPKEIWSGQVHWYMANLNSGRGRILQSNRQNAMALNFSCGVVINLCQVIFNSYTNFILDGSIADFGYLNPQVCTNTCSGTPVGSGCTGCSYSWNSEDSSIASISDSGTNQDVNLLGASPGGTYIDGSMYGMGCSVQANPSPPVIVIPTVAISGPSVVPISGTGSTNTIQLTAMGTPSGGTYSWSSSNSNFTLTNGSTATVTISATASGQSTLTVTYTLNGAQATATQVVTVQIPTRLSSPTFQPVTSVTNGNVVNYFNVVQYTGACGVYQNFASDLLDQNGSIMTTTVNFTFTESFSNYSTTITGLPAPPTQSSPQNTSIQRLADTQYLGGSYPNNCLGSNDNETFDQSFNVKIGTTTYPLTTVRHISLGSFSGTQNVTVMTTTQ